MNFFCFFVFEPLEVGANGRLKCGRSVQLCMWKRQRLFPTVADFKHFYGKMLSMTVVKAHAYAFEGYSQKVRNARMTTTTGPRLVESVDDAPTNPFYS